MKREEFKRKKDETDLVLAALADPLRRAILDDLDTCIGRSVSDFRLVIPLTRQGIRKHLAEMIKAGIVIRWRADGAAIYFIDPRPIRRVFAALGRRYRRDLAPLGVYDAFRDSPRSFD